MLDAYVVGCSEREQVYHRHAQFVQDYQFWGHWAHKRQDAQGRIYYLSPEVMLGQAQGRMLDPLRLRRALRLRQVTRTVRQYGQIRLHNFGVYVDQGLWGHTVEVWVYDDVVRIEQGEQTVVSYPCVYDPRQRCLIAIDARGRQPYCEVPVMQLVLWTLNRATRHWYTGSTRRRAISVFRGHRVYESRVERFSAGPYGVAHATLSPDGGTATCAARPANPFVAAFCRLNRPNPYSRFADTAWDRAPRRRDHGSPQAGWARICLGLHQPRRSRVHVSALTRGQFPPRLAERLPRGADLRLLRPV